MRVRSRQLPPRAGASPTEGEDVSPAQTEVAEACTPTPRANRVRSKYVHPLSCLLPVPTSGDSADAEHRSARRDRFLRSRS